MHAIQSSYRGLNLLITINRDRLLFIAVLTGSLYLGAFLGSLAGGL